MVAFRLGRPRIPARQAGRVVAELGWAFKVWRGPAWQAGYGSSVLGEAWLGRARRGVKGSAVLGESRRGRRGPAGFVMASSFRVWLGRRGRFK